MNEGWGLFPFLCTCACILLSISFILPFSIQPRSMLNKARGRHNFYANLLHVFNTFVATAVAVVAVVVY